MAQLLILKLLFRDLVFFQNRFLVVLKSQVVISSRILAEVSIVSIRTMVAWQWIGKCWKMVAPGLGWVAFAVSFAQNGWADRPGQCSHLKPLPRSSASQALLGTPGWVALQGPMRMECCKCLRSALHVLKGGTRVEDHIKSQGLQILYDKIRANIMFLPKIFWIIYLFAYLLTVYGWCDWSGTVPCPVRAWTSPSAPNVPWATGACRSRQGCWVAPPVPRAGIKMAIRIEASGADGVVFSVVLPKTALVIQKICSSMQIIDYWPIL